MTRLEDQSKRPDRQAKTAVSRLAEKPAPGSGAADAWPSVEATVRFEPMGTEASVSQGTRVYDVAMRLGLPLAQSCSGDGVCGQCGVRVLRGAEVLGPEGQPERNRKAANRVSPTLRLACLTTVCGDVVLTTDYW